MAEANDVYGSIWGAGAAGGDQVFGNPLAEADLQPVFEKAMECGLNL